MKILMVCLGNICRSPLAEGILTSRIRELGLPWEVDSAGTGSWHIGERPDPRSIHTAAQHALDISGQRARQLSTADFDRFDLILAMDRSNLRDILALASEGSQREKVRLIMDYAPTTGLSEVPDPYWDDDGFHKVFRMLTQAVDGLIQAHLPGGRQ